MAGRIALQLLTTAEPGPPPRPPTLVDRLVSALAAARLGLTPAPGRSAWMRARAGKTPAAGRSAGVYPARR